MMELIKDFFISDFQKNENQKKNQNGKTEKVSG